MEPDDILVVAGVAQSMALLAQHLRREGIEAIGVEDPGSRGAVDELEYWRLRAVPVGPPGLVLGYASHPPDRLRAAGATITRTVGQTEPERT